MTIYRSTDRFEALEITEANADPVAEWMSLSYSELAQLEGRWIIRSIANRMNRMVLAPEDFAAQFEAVVDPPVEPAP